MNSVLIPFFVRLRRFVGEIYAIYAEIYESGSIPRLLHSACGIVGMSAHCSMLNNSRVSNASFTL